MDLSNLTAEFWGDLQVDYMVKTRAFFLANRSLESIVRTDGKTIHKPILSHPQVGTYTRYVDIEPDRLDSEDEELVVDTAKYAYAEIDDLDTSESKYPIQSRALQSIKEGLLLAQEQEFIKQIANAEWKIANGVLTQINSVNVVDIAAEADTLLGATDISETAMRAWVIGPNVASALKVFVAGRETARLGDEVLENGVVLKPFLGHTVVISNDLPWSAKLGLATNPTDGDTVTIAGVTFTFKATPADPGHVDIGADAAGSRANLKAAIEGGSGEGTTYIDIPIRKRYRLRRKRNITCTTAADMVFAGFGDIAVRSDLTAGADGWKEQKQQSAFMIRGAIDSVMQLKKLEMPRKEKGFADLPKGLIKVGNKMFQDGQEASVLLNVDASNFK